MVFHIETCQREKQFLRYLQNHFENQILKLGYIGLFTIQEILQIYEIIRLGPEIGIINEELNKHTVSHGLSDKY